MLIMRKSIARYGNGGPVDPPRVKTTVLTPEEELVYSKWKQTLPERLRYDGNGGYDGAYDLRGFWKSNPTFSMDSPDAHLPDTYKLPNHPTFSSESIYYNDETKRWGGEWKEDIEAWRYTPNDKRIRQEVVDPKPGYREDGRVPYNATPKPEHAQPPIPMKAKRRSIATYGNGGGVPTFQEYISASMPSDVNFDALPDGMKKKIKDGYENKYGMNSGRTPLMKGSGGPGYDGTGASQDEALAPMKALYEQSKRVSLTGPMTVTMPMDKAKPEGGVVYDPKTDTYTKRADYDRMMNMPRTEPSKLAEVSNPVVVATPPVMQEKSVAVTPSVRKPLSKPSIEKGKSESPILEKRNSIPGNLIGDKATHYINKYNLSGDSKKKNSVYDAVKKHYEAYGEIDDLAIENIASQVRNGYFLVEAPMVKEGESMEEVAANKLNDGGRKKYERPSNHRKYKSFFQWVRPKGGYGNGGRVPIARYGMAALFARASASVLISPYA